MIFYVILAIQCSGNVCTPMKVGPTFSDKAQCEKVAKGIEKVYKGAKCDWWMK